MSQVKISGDVSGTGIFTISAPNSNTNRALVLPDSAGTMATAESTLVQFNVTGSAPVYACRAWVNFDGTGVVAIRASGNVSSVADNGVGNYTVNFTTAMPDINYSFQMHCIEQSGGDRTVIAGGSASSTAPTVSALNFNTFQSLSSTLTDANFVAVAIFR